MYTTKQFWLSILIVAIIFSGLGFFVASINKSTDNQNIFKINLKADNQNTFQAGWEAAKQRLKETGMITTIEGMGITTVSGEIKQFQDNKINLKINPLEPLADPELDNRIVLVDDSTKIYQLVGKNQEQYQKEVEEFGKKMAKQTENPEEIIEPIESPEPFTKKVLSLDDIKIGQRITVIAQEDIKEVKQFKAIEIIVEFIPGSTEDLPL